MQTFDKKFYNTENYFNLNLILYIIEVKEEF